MSPLPMGLQGARMPSEPEQTLTPRLRSTATGGTSTPALPDVMIEMPNSASRSASGSHCSGGKEEREEGGADHDAAGPAAGFGEVGDAFHLPQPQAATVVQMDVDASVVARCQCKYAFEMPDGVAVHARRVQPADMLHAQFQRCAHQLQGARLNQHAGLGKGDKLHVDDIAVAFAQRQHRVDTLQFQLLVDIDVTAKIQRATRNAMLDQGAGALCQRHVDGPEHAPLIGNLVAQAWPRGVGMPG